MMKWIFLGAVSAVYSLIDAIVLSLLAAAIAGFLSWLFGAQHPRDIAQGAAVVSVALVWTGAMAVRMDKVAQSLREARMKRIREEE